MVDATKPPYERERLKQKTRVFNRKGFFTCSRPFHSKNLSFAISAISVQILRVGHLPANAIFPLFLPPASL